MEDILFLCHRIPYPPNKGDKIRSFNILKFVHKHYRVHLGTFIDDDHDWRYVDDTRQYCESSCFLKLAPLKAKIKSLTGLLTGEALTLPYYRNRRMQRWVDQSVSERSIKRIFIFSAAMAQFIPESCKDIHTVVDFVDVDSDKWRQYSESKSWPMGWLYGREHKRLLEFERRVARKSDASLFVTQQESEFFRTLAPEVADSVDAIDNGVDTDFFNPDHNYENPYDNNEQAIVFTGAMDYWANVDAVEWFATEVFPLIRQENSKARFYIVGARPTEKVLALKFLDGVHVTGAVKEIRPYIAHAHCAVAPLRIARGVQNKVLEAMAMGKAVVTTSQAMSGIRLCDGLGPLIADDAHEMAKRVASYLNDQASANLIGKKGRECVMSNYNWENNLQLLLHLFGDD